MHSGHQGVCLIWASYCAATTSRFLPASNAKSSQTAGFAQDVTKHVIFHIATMDQCEQSIVLFTLQTRLVLG